MIRAIKKTDTKYGARAEYEKINSLTSLTFPLSSSIIRKIVTIKHRYKSQFVMRLPLSIYISVKLIKVWMPKSVCKSYFIKEAGYLRLYITIQDIAIVKYKKTGEKA